MPMVRVSNGGTEIIALQKNVSGDANIDVRSRLSNYQSLTASNFFTVSKSIKCQTDGSQVTLYPGVNSYNSSTGILSIKGRVNSSNHNYTSTQDVYYIAEPLP